MAASSGRPDLQAARCGNEPFAERRCNRALHENALRRYALLPARLEGRGRDLRRGIVDVGVVHHDVRRVRTQLGQEFLVPRRSDQRITGGGSAGECHGTHVRVRHQSVRRFTVAGDDIEKPFGEAPPP